MRFCAQKRLVKSEFANCHLYCSSPVVSVNVSACYSICREGCWSKASAAGCNCFCWSRVSKIQFLRLLQVKVTAAVTLFVSPFFSFINNSSESTVRWWLKAPLQSLHPFVGLSFPFLGGSSFPLMFYLSHTSYTALKQTTFWTFDRSALTSCEQCCSGWLCVKESLHFLCKCVIFGLCEMKKLRLFSKQRAIPTIGRFIFASFLSPF